MKKKLLQIVICFFLILLLSVAMLFFATAGLSDQTQRGADLVLLNEIEQLSSGTTDDTRLHDAISALRESIGTQDYAERNLYLFWLSLIFLALGALFLTIVFFYIYKKILRPFHRLERYAEEIAGGNLDVTLDYERTNFFGEFTWAFDHMREEILHAKKKEQAAISENKTVIAALSHDIKTPIASIRAYSEALEANLNSEYETRQRYVCTIMKKCDEVTALVNDLVLHSLSELEKLEIHMQELEIAPVIEETAAGLEFPGLTLHTPLPCGTVCGDGKRIAQIIENLINNARKYAPGKGVHVYAEINDGFYCVHVRDEGNGIPPEDMPFILQKFYRGRNAADQPGSGLGLYIVKYLIEAMHGSIRLSNSPTGLDAVFSLPLNKDIS